MPSLRGAAGRNNPASVVNGWITSLLAFGRRIAMTSLGFVMLCALSACVIGTNWSPRILGASQNAVIMSNGLRIAHGPLPAGWRVTEKTAQTIHFGNANQAERISLGVQCGKLYEDIPLKSLMGQLLTGIPTERMLGEESLQVANRGALRQRSLRRVDGHVVYCDAVVLKKDECQLDAYVVAAPSQQAAIARDFMTFVQGVDF